MWSAGRVGCTQPRRIAATSVAARVAEELGCNVGEQVGYQVRFDNRTGRDTLIKFMTDGILLAETQADCSLLAYDGLVIDEVHERSLNIDFLLGYLKRLLARRRNLKLIVSSATLDVDRFSAFFDGAPIVCVEGRTYPVEVLYREPEDEEGDLASEVASAVTEIAEMESQGDMLVFLTGEQDILETARVLEGRRLANTEIIPLYARLPVAQQKRAFKADRRRRIILATNVAETSVTIPRIHIVVDCGLARIKRYNHRTQVEKLHIEKISQASARQRKGRCGRIGPGVCVRLYGEDDLQKRPEYTDPEIKRSSLASVILAMLNLQLGRVEDFPFLDPPRPGMIRDGYRELQELGAVDAGQSLTAVGRKLARFPVEPRLARILLEGARNKALRDVLVVVAGLSIDDPRLRPPEKEGEADRAHARYATETSDFSAMLRLWQSLEKIRSAGSESRLRTHCRKNFLSYRRAREWRFVRRQLEEECTAAKLGAAGDPTNEERLHRSLLAGLLNKIGIRQEDSRYAGARGLRFLIHPGSCLAGKSPEWIVAAELVETSRLFGRTVGVIDPSWIEPLARAVCRRTYGAPYWDARTGFVRAEETVLLYGLAIVQGRKRHFGPIDPVQSREIFIQHALVQRELNAPPPVVRENWERIARIESLEAKIRRRDVLVAESTLFDLYDARLPAGVCSARDLKTWLQREGRHAKETFALSDEQLRLRTPDEIAETEYPERLGLLGEELSLQYRFRAGEANDGVTCTLSPATLQALPEHAFEWLVPGLLGEKVEYLLKGLPKRYRRPLVPVRRAAAAFAGQPPLHGKPLRSVLARWVLVHHGVSVPPDAWVPEQELPNHLRIRCEVRDGGGALLAEGRDLARLKESVGGHIERSAEAASREQKWSRTGITEWDFGELPLEVDVGQQGWKVLQFPGLQDAGKSVGVRLYDTLFAARRASTYGLVRLAMIALPSDTRQLRSLPPFPVTLQPVLVGLGLKEDVLRDDILRRAIAAACGFLDEEIPRAADAFVERICERKNRFYSGAKAISESVADWLEAAGRLSDGLARLRGDVFQRAAEDMQGQLRGLLCAGFLLYTPERHLRRYGRYLRGMDVRVERLRVSPQKDAVKLDRLSPHLDRWREASGKSMPGDPEALETYRWMLEEWRISLFAQELGTLFPVSAKRLDRQWEKVDRRP